MKKLLLTGFVILSFAIPATALASLSSGCYPSVDCDAGKEAYGTPILCRTTVDTLASCTAINGGNAFSCSNGCYTVTSGTVPPPSCPTVSFGTGFVPALTTIANNGVAQLWDCATKALYSTIAFAPNGDISNPIVKDIPGDISKAQCIADGGTPTDNVGLNPTKCRFPVNTVSGLRVKDHSGNALLMVNDFGNISNPAANPVSIKDNEGLDVWQDVAFNANHYNINPSTGITYTQGDAGFDSPVKINDNLDVKYEIKNQDLGAVLFRDPDGVKIADTAAKPYPADLLIDPVYGFMRYFNDVAYSSSKSIPKTTAAFEDCFYSGGYVTGMNTSTPQCMSKFGFFGGVTAFGQDYNDVALYINNDDGSIVHPDSSPVEIDDYDGLLVNGPVHAKSLRVAITGGYTTTVCTDQGGTVVFTMLPAPNDKYCKFSEGNMTVDGTLDVSGTTNLGNTTFHSNATGNLFTANNFTANVGMNSPTYNGTTVDVSGHISAGGGIGSYSTVDSGAIAIAAGGTDASSISCAAGGTATSCGYWVSSGSATNVNVYNLYPGGNYCNVYAKNNGGASINFHRYVRCFDPNG
jgi:hypothetical protein